MTAESEANKALEAIQTRLILLIGACRMPRITKKQIEESLQRFVDDELPKIFEDLTRLSELEPIIQELVEKGKAVVDNLREGDFISSTRLDELEKAISAANRIAKIGGV